MIRKLQPFAIELSELPKAEDNMKKKIILFLFFMLCSYIITNGCSYIVGLHVNSMYSEKPIMRDSVFFFIEGDSEQIDLSWLDENTISDCTLLYEDIYHPSQYHVVFSEGNRDIFYGKYLDAWNFDEGRTGKIIGNIGTTEYDYDVIAICDDYGIAARENAVFLLDNRLSEISTDYMMVLASGQEGRAQSQFTQLEKKMHEKGISINRVEASFVVFGNYNDNEAYIYVIALIFFAVMFIIFCVGIILWLNVNKTYFRVLLMFGEDKAYLKVILPFLMLWTVSFGMLIIFYIFTSVMDSYHISVCTIISLIVALLLTLPVLCKNVWERRIFS